MSLSKEDNLLLYDDFFISQTFNKSELLLSAQTEVQKTVEILTLKSKSKILDIACGAGRHLKEFSRLGFECYGVDISESCVKFARKNCHEIADKIICDDFLNFSKKYFQSFDLVFLVGITFGYGESYEENLDFIRAIDFVLKPKGKLVVQFINKNWSAKVYANSLKFWSENEKYYILDQRKHVDSFLLSEKIFINKTNRTEKRYKDKVQTFMLDEILNLIGQTNSELKVRCVQDSVSMTPFDENSKFPTIFIEKM